MARMTCPCGATFERQGLSDTSEKYHERQWMADHEPHPALRLAALLNYIETKAEPGQPAGKSEGLDDAGPVPPHLDSPRRQDGPS
jgi:hypothetical protein